MLQAALCYDQLNAGSLASMEIIGRQLQLVEEKQYERSLKPDSVPNGAAADAHLYMGSGVNRGRVCVAPVLSDWIAEELRKEASVLKERRKAREERASLKKGKANNNKGES